MKRILEFINNLPDWFKWILILPASLLALIITRYLGYLLAVVNVNMAMHYVGKPEPGILENIWLIGFPEYVGWFSFIWVGAYLAPKKKFVVAIILSFLVCIGMGLGLMAKYVLGNSSSTSWFSIIVALVATFFAIGATLPLIYNSEEDPFSTIE